ncbi:MAG: hypothetical protein IJH00_04055, partial [Erysipelotrichaceae bacterium]|nr:hypothetical protein [Erysipelotrichaceae bacterium]
ILLEDDKNKNHDNLKISLENIQAELKSKYETYVGRLDQNYEEERKRREEELSVLNYNISQEEEQLVNRNNFLAKRLLKKQEQYKVGIDEKQAMIDSIKHEVEETKLHFEEKVDELNRDIDKTKHRNEEIVSIKMKEYADELEETKKQYALKLEDINTDIAAVDESIDQINKEIEKLNKQADDYKEAFEAKKENLEKDEEAYVNSTNAKRRELEERLAAIARSSQENREAHEASVGEVEDKKKQSTEAYEAEMAAANNEFNAKVEELKKLNEERQRQSLNEHNEKLAELQADFDDRTAKANAEYEAKKTEYENAKRDVDNQIDEVYEETEAMINAMQVERSNLLDSIAKIEADIADKQAAHDELIAQLDEERNARIEQIAKKHEEEVAAIVEEFETNPTIKLQQVKEEYNEAQRQFNENAGRVANRIKEIDDEERRLVEASQLNKSRADQRLAEANDEYGKAKEEADNLETSLNSDLSSREMELEDLRKELNEQLREVKERNQNEINLLNMKQDEEYAQIEANYKAQEDEVSKQYEEKISTYREDLETRRNNLDSLIAEINARKQAAENECAGRYNVVAEKTKNIQSELDDIIKQSEARHNELSEMLNRRQEEINNELEKIKENNAYILQEKQAAYDRYIAEVNERCDGLRQEINELEQRKANDSSRLETYEKDKRDSMEALKNSTKTYVDSIAANLEQMAIELSKLREEHSRRVMYIKTQIASTMSDYDNLLRSRPEIIENAENDDELDLTARTQAFKEKLNELEKTHNRIMEELAEKRDETINTIQQDIDNLEVDKTNRLKECEEQIKGISDAYKAMLQDEIDKQKVLSAEVKKVKAEEELFLENMQNEDLTTGDDFEAEKERLARIHEKNLAESKRKFNNISATLKSEFNDLVDRRKVLDYQMKDLIDRFSVIDNAIADEELKLKYESNSKLLGVRKLFEEEMTKKKGRLSVLDAFADEDHNLFS